MKRSIHRNFRTNVAPVALRDEEYAATLAKATIAFDDRVGEDIFDFDDERAELDVIVQKMNRDKN